MRIPLQKRILLAALNLFLLLQAFHVASAQPPLFQSLPSSETGIHFNNRLVESPEQNIITYEYFYNGGGVAAADFNNDGLIDLFFTSNQQPDKLYLNKGNWNFQDISRQAGVEGRSGWKTGVTVADVNADGYLDIYVCYSGNVEPRDRRNRLFINNKNLTFTDRAEEYGVADAGYSTQAVFFDFDRDGDLDLFVINHNIKNLRNFNAAFVKKMIDADAGDRLYENRDNKFVDITTEAGIISNPLGYGLGVVVSDINNDGWPDLYVSNDYVEEDYLYINNQSGGFRESLRDEFGHLSNFSMGLDIADINNDGFSDIVTLDMLPEDNKRQKLLYAPDNYELYRNTLQNGFYHQLMRNMLQLNNGNGTFSEIGQFAGISNTDWSWSALLADLNNDGNKDLFVTNGYGRDMINRDFMKFYANERLKFLRGQTDERMFRMLQGIRSTPLQNYVFENNGSLGFKNRSNDWGFTEKNFSHGAVYADLDNDGDLDIVINNMNEEAGVYRNMLMERNKNLHFTRIRLSMPGKNPLALGARVQIFSAGKKYYLENYAVHGFQSAMQGPLQTGIPDGRIDSILVQWPNGKEQKLNGPLPVDQLITISFKPNEAKDRSVPASPLPVFRQVKTILPFRHIEDDVNDFKVQPLLPNMFSYNGPRLAKADVNGDGRLDVYVCGARMQAGSLVMQQSDGSFRPQDEPQFRQDSVYEDEAAVFFDADGDGDPDLYVVSGGFLDSTFTGALQDRLYINEKGHFIRHTLPAESNSGSCVQVLDFDNDGDADLFVGSRVIPGRYPEAPESLLLQNDGKGNFKNVIADLAPELQRMGMITDAVATDLDGDGRKELLVCGEWMGIECFRWQNGRLKKVTETVLPGSFNGWWNRLAVADVDKDGDEDLIAGNWGTNSQFNASPEKPVTLYYGDFDGNGFIDPLMCYYIGDTSYPVASRDELTDQIVSLRQRFPTYDAYSEATIGDILTKDQIREAGKLKADYFHTVWFENDQGKLKVHSLPEQVDFFPVCAIAVDDFTGDGNPDLFLAGNIDQVRIRIGRMDAGYGTLLAGDGKGHFTYVDQRKSGLQVKGCVKDALLLPSSSNGKNLVLGINDQETVTLKYK